MFLSDIRKGRVYYVRCFFFSMGSAKIIRTLTGVESDINQRDGFDTSLHYAATFGNLHVT